MHGWTSLSHVRWDCKYHVVLIPKYRQKRLSEKFRSRDSEIIKDLCRQRAVDLLDGHLMADHVHMCLRVPPKFSIAFVIFFLKGKGAVLIHRRLLGHRRITVMHFWTPGYCVSTVELNESTIRRCARKQEVLESAQMELNLKLRGMMPQRGFSGSKSPSRGLPKTFRYTRNKDNNKVSTAVRNFKELQSIGTNRDPVCFYMEAMHGTSRSHLNYSRGRGVFEIP